MIHYDQKNNILTPYTHDPETVTSINPGHIFKVIRDKSDVLWVVTPSAISKADLNKKPFRVYQHIPSATQSLSNNMVLDVSASAGGTLWVATAHGLNRKLPDRDAFQHYMHDNKDATSISHNEVWLVHADQAGRIWSSSVQSGIIDVWDPQTDSFSHFEQSQDSTGYQGQGVFFMYNDKADNLWIGSEMGLTLYDSGTERYSLFTPKPGEIFPVRAILEDAHGLIWVGTEGSGLYSFDNGYPCI